MMALQTNQLLFCYQCHNRNGNTSRNLYSYKSTEDHKKWQKILVLPLLLKILDYGQLYLNFIKIFHTAEHLWVCLPEYHFQPKYFQVLGRLLLTGHTGHQALNGFDNCWQCIVLGLILGFFLQFIISEVF